MNLLSWVLTIAVATVLYWQEFHLLYIIVGAICTMVLVSLFTRRSAETIVKPGTQIVVSSVSRGQNIGSEPSPFGTRGVKEND